MLRRALAASCVLGCSGAASPPRREPLVTPPASTACYSGLTTGMGQTARTIARRTIDPATRQIVEDVSRDDGGAHGAKTYRVVMAVDGDQFTMTEAGGAFSGAGSLAGEPWRWTSWTSSSQIPNTGITVESDYELTPTGMTATKQITKDGKLLATTRDDLKSFDCADWDAAKAALAVPVLDVALCERACRAFATLTYWERAEPVIAALPPADQAAARSQQEAELASKLAGGVAPCATQCMSANNAAQTACLARAQTVEQLRACD